MTSLLSRCLSKLTNNFIGLICGLVTAIIVPKSLGPAHYGDFSFIRDGFESLINTIDLNTSSAHFMYSSRHEESKSINQFYFYFCLLVGIALIIIVSLFFLTGNTHYMWPGQKILFVYAGAMLGFLIYLTTNLTKLSDSKGLTVAVEKLRTLTTLSGIVILCSLFYLDILNLYSFFAYSIVFQLMMGIFFLRCIKKNRIFDFRFKKLSTNEIKSSAKYFYEYSFPLFTASLIGFFLSYFDRWFLQLVQGSASQGFYSFSCRLASICILFTDAMTPIYSQSIAKAHADNKLGDIQSLFRKVRLFYFITAFISFFLLFHAKEIVFLIGGNKYSGAVTPVMIMLFYPIYQTYGRFCGAMILSIERTDIYRNISIISSCIGVILSFILLAPSSFVLPGMNLGAIGLSLKVIIVQVIAVNIMLFYICKIIKKPFHKYFLSQITTLIPLVVIGCCLLIIENNFREENITIIRTIVNLLIYGFLYSISNIGICLMFPGLLGLTNYELKNYMNLSLKYLRFIK